MGVAPTAVSDDRGLDVRNIEEDTQWNSHQFS